MLSFFILCFIFTFAPIYNLISGPSVDTTPPTDVTDLKAREIGGDVYLWWSSASDNKGIGGYKVWRGVFTGMISCALPTTTYITSNTFFSDASAVADNNNYYYFVRAYDTSGNQSVNFSDLGFKICRNVTYQTTISNMVWWSVPYWYMPDLTTANAQILADDMNGSYCTSGCSCTKVGRWRDDTQIYQNYILWVGAWGPPGSNFGLSAGVGYLAINLSSQNNARHQGRFVMSGISSADEYYI